ncbi:hypothetical protein N7494_005476 [Penicillium frequentans]|uniref:Uncharacterized protein n=1 Tax=Penicillium frequentans TaxID=3151616 RepID=A0AAD6CH80_9EURO|nr:hypothetical protein N7494_013217 [Penicillium glabrum]KAJ5523022.1 hypothetical protein N7494_013208 [Penicillium glabrum]KAJ5544197.1 hypothetical protein N7494_005476 [Penicillium glabrum]
MESRNIPDGMTGTDHPRVVTYLEGEVIDFQTYSLKTNDTSLSCDLDAHYWNLMPPFRDLDPSVIANKLLCSRCVPRQDMAGYILMRWKERHSITSETLQDELSVRGLYYISFRRLDGEIMGIYRERGDHTTQEICLKPDSSFMTCPAYSFR